MFVGLMEQVAELNAIVKGRRVMPDKRVMIAAVNLHAKIKSWDPASRELIDALDARISADIGDFVLALDDALRR